MLVTYTIRQLETLDPHVISDELEHGHIVVFDPCPVPLPNSEDKRFLLEELPWRLKLKNISYHWESDRVYGFRGTTEETARITRILKEHGGHVQEFLHRVIPNFTQDWVVATCSFRPIEEQGRNLPAHASNELVHIDAGAYGATHGDRILRFFVNINPNRDRVWITKGTFPELYARWGEAAGVAPPRSLTEGPLQRLYTGALRRLSKFIPPVQFMDSSPYDRTMRRFHNFMKDSSVFQQSLQGHQEFRFKPHTAWMVFTDMVSHACLSGQFAFVSTFIVPLGNCRYPELSPFHILQCGPSVEISAPGHKPATK
jgi:hypothetical protein